MINGVDELCTRYNEKIIELKTQLLEAHKNIIKIDNASLEESGYSYACDTHDHDDCGDCVVNKSMKYVEENE